MIDTLYIIAITENECRLFMEDGGLLTWTETKKLNELPSLIEQANQEAEANDLKTIITVENVENERDFIIGRYELNYITYEARPGDWETENEKLQNYIHKIQAGLF